MWREVYVEAIPRAIVHLGLRDHDRALEWLERGYEERSWLLLWLGSWPLFDPLRTNPRFRALLARIGGIGIC